MDVVLQSHFARVEAALGTLVESIATYNPSTQAALDLVAADDELSDGLDQLSYHQANHTRILALRAEAEALEAQVKASVTTLANLRRELLKAPSTTFPEDSRPVPINELLAYARKIASHTVPPTYRESDPPKAEPEGDKDAAEGATSSNGLGTPAVGGGATIDGKKDKDATTGEGLKEVTEQEAEWIKKHQEYGSQWTPYPHNSKILRGNLMAIQRHLLDYKKDPWKEKVDVDAQGDEAQAEEQAGKTEQQGGELQREDPRAAPVRKESVVARPPVDDKPKQQFNLFDDFDEDD